MVTLIAIYKGGGDGKPICVGRCDAKCHDADSPPGECDCICSGANHGAGKDKAIENTRQMAEEWIERYAREKGLEDYSSRVSDKVLYQQLSLF